MASSTQKILGINTSFFSLNYTGLTEVPFRAAISFMDYDAVILDSSDLAQKYEPDNRKSFQGKRQISMDDSFRMKYDFSRIKTQITEFLKHGKNVFVLMGQNENCFVYTGKQKIAGTGINSTTANYLDEFDVFSFLPMDFKPMMVRGTVFDRVCCSPYSSFFQTTKDLAYYDGYFIAPKKSALLTLPNSDKAVAAVFEHEKGKIIVLPHPYLKDDYETTGAWKKFGKKYLDALIELNHALSSSTDSYVLPLWTNTIKVLNEQDEEHRLEQEEKKLRSIEAAIQKHQNRIQDIKRKKLLLAASGTPLEEVVKETLQEMGFVLHEAEVGRSDVVASFDGIDIVAEIKGVSKSAAEKHAAQLEKWTAQFIDQNERVPKAILIVNGYCDTPLAERTEEVFPDQMLTYCNARNHALVTTTQLLCLYIDVKSNPRCVKKRIKELLSCVGRYPRYLDYENYLHVAEKDEGKTDD